MNNRVGHEFNTLIVTKDSGRRYKQGNVVWECLCKKCGVTHQWPTLTINSNRHCPCENAGKWIKHRCWKGVGDLSKSMFNRIERRAKRANLEFKITIQDMWDCYQAQNGLCVLSGLPIIFDKDTKSKGTSASLDRRDNTKGYTKDNIQWIHKDINRMKLNHSQEYFLSLCKQIGDYSLSKGLIKDK